MKFKKFTTLISCILGLVSGFLDIDQLNNLSRIISTIFINSFKFVSLPIVALSLIVTISKYSQDKGKNLFKKTIKYTILTTFTSTLISLLLYLLIKPSNVFTQDLNFAIDNLNYFDYVLNIVPSNILTAFIEQNVIGILLISVFFGFGIRKISNEIEKNTVINFFSGLQSVFFWITKIIIKFIPIAIFGFVSSAVLEIKSSNGVGGLFGYLSVVVLSNLVQGVLFLPIWLSFNGINPVKTIKGMREAVFVAFFSKSSIGTLPVTISNAENNLNIDKKISRFVLPLCTTINMNGCAAFIFTTVIYVMQNYGVQIDLSTMFLWVFIAVIAAIGNAGVPMGCFFLSASLLSFANIPITLLGVILPFYGIIDMVETSLNVWSDSCVVKVVDKKVNNCCKI